MHLALSCKAYFVVIVVFFILFYFLFFIFFMWFCGQFSVSINLLYGICIHVIFISVIDVLVNFTIAFGDYYV